MKRSDISDLEALDACWGYGEPDLEKHPFADLAERFPAKVVEAKLEQLCDRGLLDYGVSLSFPWRTPEGETELARLRS